MNKLTNGSALMGSEVNTAETKTMIFRMNPQDNNSIKVIVNGVKLETTQRYTYLGIDINSLLNHSK